MEQIAYEEANQSGAKDSEANDSAGCLKLEVQNISKDSQTGYQTRQAEHLRDDSFLSAPNSCGSLIDLENNSFN